MRGEATAWWVLAGAAVAVSGWLLFRPRAQGQMARQYRLIELVQLGDGSIIAMPHKSFADLASAADAAQRSTAMGAVVLTPDGMVAHAFENGQSVQFDQQEIRGKLASYGVTL